MDKTAIRDRIRVQHTWIQPVTKTNVFSSAVPDDVSRNIIDVKFEGVGANTIGLFQLEADGVTSDELEHVEVGATSNVNLNNNYDIESPIFVLPGGSNLQMSASGNSISSTTRYWDDELT